MTTAAQAPPPSAKLDPLSGGRKVSKLPDLLLRRGSLSTGLIVLGILAAIAIFLIAKAIPAIDKDTGSFLTSKVWDPDGDVPVFGVAALVIGTLTCSLVALVIAGPIAVGVALFITQYAPKKLATSLGFVVDLLAAVPSVVFGLWGVFYLNNKVVTASGWIHDWFGWIPIFGDTGGAYGRSIFLAGVVLAIMILPIISALSREVIRQTPPHAIEAALGLGATRWEVIRMVVLPFARPGIISSIMLGLGRAFGETIAVALVLRTNFEIITHILGPGGNSIAANIATRFGDANELGRGALIASGLVLFVITLTINVAARAIVSRGQKVS